MSALRLWSLLRLYVTERNREPTLVTFCVTDRNRELLQLYSFEENTEFSNRDSVGLNLIV